MALLIARRVVYALACGALVFAFVKWVLGAPWWLAAVLAALAFPFTFFNRTEYGHDFSSGSSFTSGSSSADSGSDSN